jgi:peroxiredoxin Q/BCP
MAKVLELGDMAPEIALEADDGSSFTLSSLRGREVVLYFYPKADTPGCTAEACGFRDLRSSYADRNAVIVGVSPDDQRFQAKFKQKYDLNFVLLADIGHSVSERYGVWREKSMYGRKFYGVERTTFLISREGRIRKIYSRVRPKDHAANLLDDL